MSSVDLNLALATAIGTHNLENAEKLLTDYPDEPVEQGRSFFSLFCRLACYSPLNPDDEKKRNHIAQLLLNRGASVNYYLRDRDSGPALLIAATRCDAAFTEWLLTHGADVHAKSKYKMSALSLAVRRPNQKAEAVTDLLLNAGASVQDCDVDGYIPIQSVALFGTVKHLQLLMAREADVRSKTQEGRTLLLLAAECNNSEVIPFLLEQGLNVNAQDGGGMTALHLAAEQGHKETIAVLLQAKANPLIQNKEGKLPLEVAKHSDEAIALLQQATKDALLPLLQNAPVNFPKEIAAMTVDFLLR